MDATGNPTTVTGRVVVSLGSEIVAEVALANPVTVVGRHRACDIVIDHPAISGRHMLLRNVGGTVCVEDLASTNGTRVNGTAVENQVVHDQDLIEIGRHKLKFFEEKMPAAGGIDPARPAPGDFDSTLAAPRAHGAAEKPPVRRRNEELSRTMVIERDPTIRLGAAQEVVRTDQPGASPGLVFRVLEGEQRGELVPLDRANTMIGTPGGDTALVVKRGQSLFLTRFSGHRAPRLNRKELGPGAHPISAGDVVEVGESKFELVLAA